MRTALLSAFKQTDAGELRAGLMLGGRSVLEWQGQLMQSLGCERIICLCETPGPAILALQRQVECRGTEFHAVRGNLQLVSLIRADDELVMLMDGLLASADVVRTFAGENDRLEKAIATVPTANSLVNAWPDDFERIDRDRHWAGLAIMRASQVHKLADLPPDSDAMSLLLRLGLQARTECRDIQTLASEDGCWMLASDSDALRRRERALIDSVTEALPWTGPGRALAAVLVRRITPRWLEHGAIVSAGIAAVLLLVGIAFVVGGWDSTGLAATAMGAFVAAVWQTFSDVRAGLWSLDQGRNGRAIALLKNTLDAAAALTLILAVGLDARSEGVLSFPALNQPDIALPILALGIAHQAALATTERSAAFWLDRPLHLALFAAAAVGGFLDEAIALFGLGAMLQLMLHRAR
ncbi:hypothetical protein [Qipengyuania sp. ASV99]|uniref:hypothetical protein n=1 Tax=Qipengyuania sp. ASV99 TaxID=3399681 RepID=UPI003A4C6C9E